jgi:hypothetical protein
LDDVQGVVEERTSVCARERERERERERTIVEPTAIVMINAFDATIRAE